MSSGPPGRDTAPETQATDAGLGSDRTIKQAEASATPARETTGPRIRISRPSSLDHLGRYKIIKQLGRGGMGAVYEAEDPELGRRVAIKVLRDHLQGEVFTESLRREAQALAKLVHGNVVTVYDVGFDDGQAFVVMQLVDGESIDRWLRGRSARAHQILTAFRAAGRGLAAAHAAGLVHCDFKPGNVLVDRDGDVRVTDFGLARIAAENEASVSGTPSYMAPEQFEGIATAASDQYAFCVAVWEVLTGATPFPDSKIDDIQAAKARVLPAIPRSARVPSYVVRALHHGLAPDPKDRFASMDALLVALTPPAWRRRVILGAAGALVLGSTVLATFMLDGSSRRSGADEPSAGVADLSNARALTQYGTSACPYAPVLDSDRVVFDLTRGATDDLYEMPLAGGPLHQLTSAPTWEWRSNRGRKPGEVVYLVSDPKNSSAANISYLDLKTGTQTVASKVVASDAAVAANGLVYVARRGTELRRIEGGRDDVLAPVPDSHAFQQIAVSHSGTHVAAIAFSSSDPRVCTIETSTAKIDCVPSQALLARPAFGRDDRRLYYAARDGIHQLDLVTHADVLLIPDVQAEGGLAVSADGAVLVYSDCGQRSQIVDWSDRPPSVIVAGAVARSPTGISTTRLAWVRPVRGVPTLVVRTSEGVDIEVTKPDFGPIASPSMSPDGAQVAFAAGQPHQGLYTISLIAGAQPQRVSGDRHDRKPVWIDNDRLAFARLDDQTTPTMYASRADGAMMHALSGSARFAIGGNGREVLAMSSSALYWVDPTSGAERPGPSIGGIAKDEVKDPITSPDGHWLVFRTGAEGQVVWRMALDPPSQPEHLPDLPAGQTIFGAAITNGGHVLMAPDTWSGDLHAIPARGDTRF
jgi:Tol biopolymer transport system component/predicted Ser/Thr protein kinase